MDASAFFLPLPDGRFQATEATVGPWDPALQHGAPPQALLTRALLRAAPPSPTRIAHLAFDFFGPAPVGPCETASEVRRPGARIELTEARLVAGGRVAVRVSAWRIAVGEGRAAARGGVERPAAVPSASQAGTFVDAPGFGYGDAMEWRFVEGRFDTLGPATVWARPRVPLVLGEEPSPMERLLLMVDSANGISAELSPTAYLFVPVALTLSVVRAPRTEWVGMRARAAVEADGIGTTRAELFDEEGFLGTAIQTMFVAPR